MTSNQSQWPSSSTLMSGVSSFHSRTSRPGEFTAQRGRPGDLAAPAGVAEMDAQEDQAQGDDGQIEAPKSHRHRGHSHPHQGRYDACAGKPDPDRQRMAPGRLAAASSEVHRGACAHAHEEGVAQRHLTGHTGQQVEAEGGDSQDHQERHGPHPVAVTQEADHRDLIDDRQIEGQQEQHRHEQCAHHLLGPRRQQLRLLPVCGVQTGADRALLSVTPSGSRACRTARRAAPADR